MTLKELSFTKTLFAFDFDGTLAKIARTPSKARMHSSTTELLVELSHLVPVAIVSGRTLNDLKQRVPVPIQSQYIVGNHGLEGAGKNRPFLEKAKSQSSSWRVQLKRARFEAGIEVEDKTYSVSIHYRRARKKRKARREIQDTIAKLRPPPRVLKGKLVFNLLPTDAPDKGFAVLKLMRNTGAKHVLYVGDDDTDEDVFRIPESRIITVRVGRNGTSKARYFIRRQSDIIRLLKLLIRYQLIHHQPSARSSNTQA